MMVGFFQWVVVHQKQIPERFVMALEMAKAVQTPLAPPDMSSPSSSFANLSFINSTSAITDGTKNSQHLVLQQDLLKHFSLYSLILIPAHGTLTRFFVKRTHLLKNHLNLTRHDLGQQT